MLWIAVRQWPRRPFQTADTPSLANNSSSLLSEMQLAVSELQQLSSLPSLVLS